MMWLALALPPPALISITYDDEKCPRRDCPVKTLMPQFAANKPGRINEGFRSLSSMYTLPQPELDPRDAYYQLAAKNPSLTREDFAELMGVERQSINRWFAGIREPNRIARRLAAELVKTS